MAIHAASRIIPAPRDLVFDLVADVETYPEFLPLWRDARIHRRDDESYLASQEVGLEHVNAQFRTRTQLKRPTSIEVTSEDKVFSEFLIRWDFDSVGTNCWVALVLACQLKARTVNSGVDYLLSRAALPMLMALENRASAWLGANGAISV